MTEKELVRLSIEEAFENEKTKILNKGFTMKIKWTEAKVLEVMNGARFAGKIAADAKLAQLVGAGPKWSITDDNTGKSVGTMLDVCGFANLKIPARGKFYTLAKKLGAGNRFSCGRHYYGGGRLNIFDSTMRQEMSVNVAACKAQAAYLAKYGIMATTESRMD